MYKAAALVYVVCFFCYILFSRMPDYFGSDFTRGVVVTTETRAKSIHYKVANEAFSKKLSGWSADQVAKGDTVRVIFDPSDPTTAAYYSFFGYWLTLSELLLSALGFILSFIAAIFITGKEDGSPADEDFSKKRKYTH
jgi:hypothetical protein